VLIVAEPIAERAILEVTGGVSCYSAWDIERIADQVTERAVDPSPQGLAAECGVPIVLEPLLPAAVPAQMIRGTIYYRSDRLRGLAVLMILHELAHHLLPRHVDHSDVWSLTLALAMPLRVIRAMRHGELHAPFAHLPAWAVALRFEMPTVLLAA